MSGREMFPLLYFPMTSEIAHQRSFAQPNCVLGFFSLLLLLASQLFPTFASRHDYQHYLGAVDDHHPHVASDTAFHDEGVVRLDESGAHFHGNGYKRETVAMRLVDDAELEELTPSIDSASIDDAAAGADNGLRFLGATAEAHIDVQLATKAAPSSFEGDDDEDDPSSRIDLTLKGHFIPGSRFDDVVEGEIEDLDSQVDESDGIELAKIVDDADVDDGSSSEERPMRMDIAEESIDDSAASSEKVSDSLGRNWIALLKVPSELTTKVGRSVIQIQSVSIEIDIERLSHASGSP